MSAAADPQFQLQAKSR